MVVVVMLVVMRLLLVRWDVVADHGAGRTAEGV